jgi:hypothetical protein
MGPTPRGSEQVTVASEPADEADRGRHPGFARHEGLAGGPGSLSLSFGDRGFRMAHDDFAIEHFTAEHIPNPNPAGKTPWYVYHTVRNAMVCCCRGHGPTGSMGIFTFDPQRPEFMFDQWAGGDADPWYYIVDDQYNSERYLYIELCRTEALTIEWIRSVCLALSRYPGWGMGIVNIPDAYVLIFDRKLMVHGEPFEECHTAVEIVEVGRAQLALRENLAD